MDFNAVQQVFSLTNNELALFIDEYIAAYGVPSDIDQVVKAAHEFMPIILDQRRRLVQETSALIVASSSLATSDIARPDYLPVQFVVKDIAQCVGLAPGLHPLATSELDQVTRELERVVTVPYLEPDNPDIQVKVSTRLKGRIGRRALDSERETVRATARATKNMYAWRVTGAEHCKVCISRAAAGAIYHDKQAADRFTHDHCDCHLELVEDVTNWQGQETADELTQLIKRHSETTGKTYKNTNWADVRREYKELAPALSLQKVG